LRKTVEATVIDGLILCITNVRYIHQKHRKWLRQLCRCQVFARIIACCFDRVSTISHTVDSPEQTPPELTETYIPMAYFDIPAQKLMVDFSDTFFLQFLTNTSRKHTHEPQLSQPGLIFLT
uniref:Uncharacterized protein n=1 Tax=Anopheles coluzzii TaxID=1518534 RepID=A0A8W7PYD2_ANOCL